MIAEVTPQEAALADALGEIWNQYLDLPVEHMGEQDEFCRVIHILQRQITSRAGRRAMRARVREKRDVVLEALSALEQRYAEVFSVRGSSSEHAWQKFRSFRVVNQTFALIAHDRILTNHPRGQQQ